MDNRSIENKIKKNYVSAFSLLPPFVFFDFLLHFLNFWILRRSENC